MTQNLGGGLRASRRDGHYCAQPNAFEVEKGPQRSTPGP
jgi:hypothetical protein